MASPVPTGVRADLVPPTPQRLWGVPAVANFALGGLGAGFYLVASLLGGASPALHLASWVGPALVLAGFAAVAAEAGRPLRGPRVLARARTSWMSRELWIGAAFVALALLDGVSPHPALRVLAAGAALALVVAQGEILRAARAIPAWNAPLMPALFVVSSALSGAGLLLMTDAVAGARISAAVLGATLALLLLALGVWWVFLTSGRDATFARATAPLRRGPLALELVAVGYVAPFVLVAVGLAVPAWAPASAVVAAVAIILGQIRAKSALVLTAGVLRPIALDLTFRRTS
jgi:phenylacetyl-CoA:acceptor oxidoreductase 26-kDa subunit